MNLLQTIQINCNTAIATLGADLLADVTPATNAKFGHYQCNSAMKLSKILQLSPRDIAAKIKVALLQQTNNIFSAIDIAGPGFLNFTIKTEIIINYLDKMQLDPRLGIIATNSSKRVIVDFSSPNTAKEMHVGHLRSTIIGDSISRILEFLGHDVLRLNHIGDWGTQFGMLISYLQHNPPVSELSELAAYYKAAKQQFDTDQNFKKQSQLAVVDLQSGTAYALKIWREICKVSSCAYQEIYNILDIEIIERGESFYNDMLPKVIELLEQQKLLENSGGAKCVFLDGFTNREGDPLPLIMQKQDGGYNYATTDFAALQQRINIERANWLIYVTDSGQAQHFNMVFTAAEKAQVLDRTNIRVDHVPFGLVLREDGKKFQTRSGNTEKLSDLITNAISKARDILQTKNPQLPENELKTAATVLGINAIKYADLSCNRTHDYKFSYARMLQFEGNTAACLLYAYVRVNGIKNKVSRSDPHATLQLDHAVEIDLALHLTRFSESLNAISSDLLPNRLTDYLYKLAEKFHSFFHQCRVVDDELQDSRLILCELTAKVIKQGLELLGLKTLEKM
ncbi:MAG: arginine--tRNA ligase [Legionellales bacterium]|nr:MAG: arginine--tRNA ligase [Legionellales bacterium]